MTRSSSTRTEIAKHTGRLYGWLIVSIVNSWLILTVSLLWGARDLGMNLFPTSVSIAQTLIPGCGGTCVPFIDALEAPGYHFGMTNIPARLVSLSIGLLQSAYYTNILAGLTARPLSGKLASITEIFLRVMAFAALPFMLIGNFYQPAWWLLLLGTGLLIPALTQALCYRLATHTFEKARGVLSTVPISDNPELKNFGQWRLGLFYYILLILGISVGLYMNFLHDVWTYAVGAVGVNVFILCFSKSIILAPGVRGSLCRAFTIGERLEKWSCKTGPANTITP